MRQAAYSDQSRHPSSEPTDVERCLSPMIEALRNATEAYLDVPLKNTDVVFPFPVSDAYYDAVYSNLSSSRFEEAMWRQPPAGLRASFAYGWDTGACYSSRLRSRVGDHVTKTYMQLLTIDYSRAALTALLVELCFDEENLQLDRYLHETRLGLNSLRTGPEGRDAIVKAIRDFAQMPPDWHDGGPIIMKIMLLGESADNPELHGAIREALRLPLHDPVTDTTEGPKVHENLIMNDQGIRKTPVEHLFAASRGVAIDIWEQIELREYRKGRSEL